MTTESASPNPANQGDLPSEIIELPLDKLKCFDVITDQFSALGIVFNNTVILEPSNVAYRAKSSKMVLMGAPKNGWIEINFTVPICFFSCRLTSSQQTTLSVYDQDNHLVTYVETEGANLDNGQCNYAANRPMSVNVPNISRITLNCLDGQLVINEVRFGC